MGITIKKQTVPMNLIKIKESFKDTPPEPEKLGQCYRFYRENHRFDRDIITDSHYVLHDGYCAYLVARMMGVKTVTILRVMEKKPERSCNITEAVSAGCRG